MADKNLNLELEKAIEENKSTKTKSEFSQSIFETGILKDILTAFIFYLIIFIINEVIISGGRYQQDFYLAIATIIFIICGLILINFKKPFYDLIDSLKRGVIYLIVFALCDFLLVNLMLEANSLNIYRWWATYVDYGILVLLPLALSQINTLFKLNR